MDHAINAVNPYFEISLENLYDEWKTGKYKNLSDCPSYGEASTYRKVINMMEYFINNKKSNGPSLKECIEGHIWVTRNIQVEW